MSKQKNAVTIFLIYADGDDSLAQLLIRHFRQNSVHHVVDHRGVPAGRDTRLYTYKRIESADVVAYIINDATVHSAVCQDHLQKARKQGKYIIPIAQQRGLKPPPVLQGYAAVDFSGGLTIDATFHFLSSVTQGVVITRTASAFFLEKTLSQDDIDTEQAEPAQDISR